MKNNIQGHSFCLTLLLCFLTHFIFAQNTIERVEPPQWWVGMKSKKLQLLIHGENIHHLDPKINYTGVAIERVIKVQSPNYLFLDLLIAADTKAGQFNIDFLKEGQKVTSHSYTLLNRAKDAAQLQGFDNKDVLYLITPDRFVNGDTNNDNIEGLREKMDRSNKGGRHGGDLQGIQQSLDYISDMGYTAIWLNPVLENDMTIYSYHGYSITDFYKVDPRYGSNEQYLELAQTARSKGIKLIMDMIVNHCGSEHWWMNDWPTKDWINKWPEYTETNHRKSVLQDPYAAKSDLKVFTDGWFVPTMPDLNQRNELMGTYLIQNSIWWIEYLGLAGIRMDTYPYPDMYFMSEWTRRVMEEYPNFNVVGEEWYESPTIVAYWQRGKENANGYTSELKSLMDFPVQMALSRALNEEESWKSGWITLYEMLAQDFLYANANDLVVFPDNHDMSRIFTQVNEDEQLFQLALSFFLTTRGVPQLYYGTEILMTNPGTTDHGIIRSDFPGGWANDQNNAFTNQGLSERQKKAKAFVRKLLRWRQTASAVHYGTLTHFIPKDGVYVYFRMDEQQKVMVILNKNEQPYTLNLDRFAEQLNGKSMGVDVISNQAYTLKTELNLPIKSALILELK